MKVLTIETTCDETAAAVVTDRLEVLGSAVASQDELHASFGGVVPEIASRAHVERILPVIDLALSPGIRPADLDAVAVATSPGLAGSLLVGLAAAKALAVALGVPLVAVNHIQAHLYACRLAAGPDVFPAVGLVVSGGHTNLYRVASALEYSLLGSTIDDAAGEAFDKVASLLGLPYPGGPEIERAAAGGNPGAFRFPRTFLNDPARFDFSFSGLKTAVRYAIAPQHSAAVDPAALAPQLVADLAASFKRPSSTCSSVKRGKRRAAGVNTLLVGGGVAANSRLRERLAQLAQETGLRVVIAPRELCTDNAVMGAIAVERLQAGLTESLDLDVAPGLERHGASTRPVTTASR